MRSSSNSLDISRLRDYYEEQGRAVRESGDGINCSERPNIEVVIHMAMEHASDFQSVADVGCGANLIYDRVIADLGKQVVAIDFTWNFLKLALPDSRITLFQADALHLPFCDDAFDAVICSETVEHISNDAVVIQELARVLRPRGWLFFTVPNLWNAARIIQMIKHLELRVRLMPGHLREYSLTKVRRLLAGSFEIQKVYPVGFGWSGSPIGGRIERLVLQGTLSRLSKSIAVAAYKL